MTDLPEPMTPPDCDLRGMPFMPLDALRLVDSDLFALSTGDEFKAAVTLWCRSWAQVPAASLPDDDRVLAHLSLSGSKWPKVRNMALHGWVKCSDGRLYHRVVADKAIEAWKYRTIQKARAHKRWGKRDEPKTTPTEDAACDADNRPTPAAMALPYAGATAMQGTVEVKKESKKEPPTLRVVPPQRRTQIKPDWQPTDAGRTFAATNRVVDIERETAKFRDYHLAKGSTMADWNAAWRTWCSRSRAYEKPAIPPMRNGFLALQLRAQAEADEQDRIAFQGLSDVARH